MQNKEWLPLSEYSNCFRVSISTLRRRIKSKKAECIYEDGKYFLKNKPLGDHKVNNTYGELTPHQYSTKETKVAPPQQYLSLNNRAELQNLAEPIVQLSSVQPKVDKNISENVEYLIEELKKAQILLLKEKEEQILILKSEITDLKMLTKALESKCNLLEKKSENKINQKLGIQVEQLHPQQIELEYVPTPNLEVAIDWLDDEI